MASTHPLPGRTGDWQAERIEPDADPHPDPAEPQRLLFRLILLAESVCAESVGLAGIDVVVVSVELFFMAEKYGSLSFVSGVGVGTCGVLSL